MVIINYHGWIIMFCSQLFCLKIGMNDSPFIRFASKETDILICPLSNLSWSYQQCMFSCHHVSHSESLCPSKWLLKTSVFHVCVLYLNCKTPQFEGRSTSFHFQAASWSKCCVFPRIRCTILLLIGHIILGMLHSIELQFLNAKCFNYDIRNFTYFCVWRSINHILLIVSKDLLTFYTLNGDV